MVKSVTTNETSLEYVGEEMMDCNQFQFEVFAFNPAGESEAVSIVEIVPFCECWWDRGREGVKEGGGEEGGKGKW